MTDTEEHDTPRGARARPPSFLAGGCASAAPSRRRPRRGAVATTAPAGAGRPLPRTSQPEHPRDHGRPAALAALVRRRRRRGAGAARRRRPRSAGASRSRATTRLQRLLAGARGAPDRAPHPPDRLHDHRRAARSTRLPDLGRDAPRAGLRHLVVREMAPHLGATAGGTRPTAAGARALRLRRRHVPLARTARPARAGASTRPSRPVRALARRSRRPPSRGARPCRSSTRTTSRGGGAGASASRPRRARRAIVGELPPNFETPAQLEARGKPRVQRSLQDTSAVSFGSVPFDGPGVASPGSRSSTSTSSSSSTSTAMSRACSRAREPPALIGEHGRRVHLRPRRVRRLARPARQGRRGLRGGDPRAADRRRPHRPARPRRRACATS